MDWEGLKKQFYLGDTLLVDRYADVTDQAYDCPICGSVIREVNIDKHINWHRWDNDAK